MVATPEPVPADVVSAPIPVGEPSPVGAVQRVTNQSVGVATVLAQPTATISDTSTDTVSTAIEEIPSTPDNLSLIRGMDPYTIQRLNDRGIISYVQISALSNDEITVIEEEFDIPGCFNRFSWRYQAQQLMNEEE
mgnify:CR=1 FL=1